MARRTLILIILSIASFSIAHVHHSDATPSRPTSALTARTVFYQRTLTLPVKTTLSQRALLAASLAASELQTFDLQALEEAYRAGLAVVNYRPLSDTMWSWVTDHWEPATRTTYTYNGEEFPIEVFSEEWDGAKWVNKGRILTVYDGSGRQTTIATQYWASTEWKNASRSVFEYDGSGNPSVTTYQSWNESTQAWVDQSRTMTTFSGSLLQSSTSEIWENNAWKRISHTTYEYDGSNRLEVTTIQFDSGGVLINASRTTRTYDGSGNIVTMLNETWSGSDWMPSSRVNYTFDGQNREVLERNESYLGGVWTPFSDDTTKWNGDRMTEVVHVDIFFGNQKSRTLYTYDDINMTEETIDQDWNPSLQAAPTAGWENTIREITVYEEYATSVQLDDEPWSPHYELGQNVPNPFNPTTVILYSLHKTADVSIAVYNLLGQHVRTLEQSRHEPGVYETRWDGTDASGRPVSSGVYFYRLTADGQIDTRKMLLLK